MNTHMRSPLRVLSGRRPDTMPPTEISSAARAPLPFAGGSAEPVGRPCRLRQARLQGSPPSSIVIDGSLLRQQVGRRLGAVDAKVLGVAIDRVTASSRGRAPPFRSSAARSSVHGGTSGSGIAPPDGPAASSPPPNRSTWPRSLLRCTRLPCSQAASIAANSRARISRSGRSAGADLVSVCPPITSESHAPDFTSASNTRLLARRRSRISHSACSDGMRPPSCSRDARIDVDRAFAEPLDRRQAEADRPRPVVPLLDRELQLALVDVRRQHARCRARALPPDTSASLSVFCDSIVSSAAVKCDG